MPANGKTGPPKATWADWLAEDGVDATTIEQMPVLTRDELIARTNTHALVAKGNDWEFVEEPLFSPVSIDDIELWEYRGVLPRPVRRKRATYPEWAVLLIRTVRQYQAYGRSLDEIGPLIRAVVRSIFSTHPIDIEIRDDVGRGAHDTLDLRLPAGLVREAHRLATWHARIANAPTYEVNVVVVATNGHKTTYHIPVAAESMTDHEKKNARLQALYDELRTRAKD